MRNVYRRAASKARVYIDADLERRIIAALKSASQQQVARQFDVSQSAVQRLATRQRSTSISDPESC